MRGIINRYEEIGLACRSSLDGLHGLNILAYDHTVLYARDASTGPVYPLLIETHLCHDTQGNPIQIKHSLFAYLPLSHILPFECVS